MRMRVACSDTAAVGPLGGKLEPELLAHHAGKEPARRMRLPARGFDNGGDRCPVGRRSSPSTRACLEFARAPVMRSSALVSAGLEPDFGGGARLHRACTLALGHVKTPLHGIDATARRTTQTPRRPNGAGGGERSEPVRLSVRDRHSCSVYDGSRVQNGVGPIVCRNLGRSCKIRIMQLAREGLRRRACAYSGEVATEFQSDSARTDSPVRIPRDEQVQNRLRQRDGG
jgi:hypothetical protein